MFEQNGAYPVKDRRNITGYNFQLSEKGPLIS